MDYIHRRARTHTTVLYLEIKTTSKEKQNLSNAREIYKDHATHYTTMLLKAFLKSGLKNSCHTK